MRPRCPECGEPLMELYRNGEPEPVGIADCAVCAGRAEKIEPAPQDYFSDDEVARVARVLRDHTSLDDEEAGHVAFEALKAAFEAREAPAWGTAALRRLARVRSTREASAEAELARLRKRVKDAGELWVTRGQDVANSGKVIGDPYTLGEGHAMQRCGGILRRILAGEDEP